MTVVPTTQATAQTTDASGFSFLRLETSARSAALAGAVTSLVGSDVDALFYNPSLLTAENSGQLSISYVNHLADLNAGVVVYGREFTGIGSFAAGVRFLNYGTLQGATETGERTGEFGAGDIALTVGGSRAHDERLNYGASVHVIYSSVDTYSASALATDLGVTYRVPESQFAVSASIHNLGFSISDLGSTNDDLPVDFRVGLSKRLAHVPLLVSIMAYNLHDLDALSADATGFDNVASHILLGGEFQFSEAFQIRIGYNHRQHEELRSKSRLDFAGFGFGTGIKINRFRFGYAYNSWSELGGLNRLSVTTHL